MDRQADRQTDRLNDRTNDRLNDRSSDRPAPSVPLTTAERSARHASDPPADSEPASRRPSDAALALRIELLVPHVVQLGDGMEEVRCMPDRTDRGVPCAPCSGPAV